MRNANLYQVNLGTHRIVARHNEGVMGTSASEMKLREQFDSFTRVNSIELKNAYLLGLARTWLTTPHLAMLDCPACHGQ